jgi:hypothetical protein
MSYQERRSIVYLLSDILISAVYFAYMSQRYPEGDAYSPEVFRFWGSLILILIPVSAVAKIVIHIIFTIINTITTNEEEPSFMDERDKLIELKATQNSLYVFVTGFLLAMISVVIEQPPSTMFILLILGGLTSSLVSDLSQFYFYRRGF